MTIQVVRFQIALN